METEPTVRLPVLRVAAVHASAGLDRELPVRQIARPIEVFRDLGWGSRFATRNCAR